MSTEMGRQTGGRGAQAEAAGPAAASQTDPTPQNPSLERPEALPPPEAKISSAESSGEKDTWVWTVLYLESHEGAGGGL